MMADGSDDPADLVTYHRILEDGFDCAFGSRFIGPHGRVTDYPRLKLVLNRIVNWGIRALFRHGYDDTTNAFKALPARGDRDRPATAREPLQPDGRDPAEGGRARPQLRHRPDLLARAAAPGARS